LLQGGRVAVVISRRARVHRDEADPRGSYGETGGDQQYDSDRGDWPAGAAVREKARDAIVAGGGTVRRVCRPDPDTWTPSGTKRQFTGTALPHERVQELAGPGNSRCGSAIPARPSRAAPAEISRLSVSADVSLRGSDCGCAPRR